VTAFPSPSGDVAVLSSGGLDSAILLAHLARQGHVVHPIYVRFGLVWEDAEAAHLRRFRNTLTEPSVRTLVELALPVADLYGSHWSLSGNDVPDAASSDAAVYLPGRNLLLLAKASVWCALHDVRAVALGTLKGNPFADSSPGFFDGFGSVAGLGLGSRLEVITPLAALSKADVLALGRDLALQHTFSCIDPRDGLHCAECNKCAERRRGFAALGMPDVTTYATTTTSLSTETR
jgi:7-cyano-7-deazaguanine synthase